VVLVDQSRLLLWKAGKAKSALSSTTLPSPQQDKATKQDKIQDSIDKRRHTIQDKTTTTKDKMSLPFEEGEWSVLPNKVHLLDNHHARVFGFTSSGTKLAPEIAAGTNRKELPTTFCRFLTFLF
jgi:hypothetical protein